MRLRARVVGPLVAALVVFSPLLREPTSDTYPLSTYPMFAFDRGADHRIATAVEIDADGVAVRLSPELIAGTDEVILASVTVQRAISGGDADELCAEIAERLGDGRTVEVRVESIDAVTFITDDTPPTEIDVKARCDG